MIWIPTRGRSSALRAEYACRQFRLLIAMTDRASERDTQ
jgi:hypothetical protein